MSKTDKLFRVAKNILIYIGVVILSSFYNIDAILGLKPEYMASHEGIFILIEFIIWGLCCVFLIRLYLRQLKKDNPRSFKLNTWDWKNILYIALGFGAIVLMEKLTEVISPGSPENQVILDNLKNYYPLLMLIDTDIFAPVIEEIVCRGIFFNLFFNKNTRFHKFMAIFVSGLVFGFLHEEALSFHLLSYSFAGWVLAALYEKTKSLYYPMILHFLLNVR